MKRKLTPIPENWEELEVLHYGAIEKFGPEAGFDSGWFHLSEEHTLKIAVGEGFEYRKGRKDMKVKHWKSRYLLAKFCPFTGRPLYEESVFPLARGDRKAGVQTSLFDLNN